MKNQGKDDHVFDPEESGQEAAERDDRKWYQKIDRMLLDEMPIVGRPRGKGTRVDFYVEPQLPDMMLEIKEASKKRFKNTNDVCRAAFYLGAYIMREKIMGRSVEEISLMYSNLECFHHKENKKSAIRKEFAHHFEQRCLGNLSDEELTNIKNIILKSIATPELKAWAKEEMGELMKMGNSNSPLFDRLSSNIRKQKARALAKGDELGIQLVGVE
jgi:hypothetical protein